MRAAIFTVWSLMQLLMNAGMLLFCQPPGLALLHLTGPLLGIIAANCMAAIAGWELAKGAEKS